MPIEFVLVDVCSNASYSGNSLAVFPDARGLSAAQVLRIIQELRHFEAIFLERTTDYSTVRDRGFDPFEELPFAGHPIIGAAAALHRASRDAAAQVWQFMLSAKTVSVTTERTKLDCYGLLDQGTPDFLGTVHSRASIAKAFNLKPEDLSYVSKNE